MAKIKLLVKKSKQGDKEAFVELMDIHRDALYNTALIITKNEQDALDALSDTVLSCWEKIPLLKNENHFKTWLTRILINNCYNILRYNRHYAHVDTEEAAVETDNDTRLDIADYLNALGNNDKLILTMFYYDDFSISQISEVLGISKSAAKTRLSRSRSHFKALYIKDHDIDGGNIEKEAHKYPERVAIYEVCKK